MASLYVFQFHFWNQTLWCFCEKRYSEDFQRSLLKLKSLSWRSAASSSAPRRDETLKEKECFWSAKRQKLSKFCSEMGVKLWDRAAVMQSLARPLFPFPSWHAALLLNRGNYDLHTSTRCPFTGNLTESGMLGSVELSFDWIQIKLNDGEGLWWIGSQWRTKKCEWLGAETTALSAIHQPHRDADTEHATATFQPRGVSGALTACRQDACRGRWAK